MYIFKIVLIERQNNMKSVCVSSNNNKNFNLFEIIILER